ncbi:MAG: lantibiotic dehydratase, partial [Micromonosporaceae bacterium]|nr:lantibiotic dehydratase [Micromonosporaceae bacterium]
MIDPPQPVFEPADPVLVRSPLLSTAIRDALGPAPAGCLQDADLLTSRLRALAELAVLREAIALSSPSLSAAWQRAIRPGADLAPVGDLIRVTASVTSYLLRATTRPTPFGLFAGVGLARFGRTFAGRLGPVPRTRTRPDAGWLAGLIRRIEADPEVLAESRVTANDGWLLRAGRAVIPDPGYLDPAGRRCAEISVSATPVVRSALRLATRPVPVHRLIAELSREFPALPGNGLAAAVADLVRLTFLLTDLHPPMSCTDPVAYLLAVLTRSHRPARRARTGVERPAGEVGAPVHRDAVRQLRQIRRLVEAYDRKPPGAGEAELQALLAGIRPAGDHLLQVDTGLDGTVRLPVSVGAELATAIGALWRMAPVAPGRLGDYHHQFVRRYGLHRPVPVPQLLSQDTGLGPPPRYAQPGPSDVDPPGDSTAQREQTLADLLAGAVRDGCREVELDDQRLRLLELGDPEPPQVPPAVEAYARVVCASRAALDAGDFRLVLSRHLGSHRVGASYARFHGLLGTAGSRVARLTALAEPGVLHAAVVHRPLDDRAVNVCTAPDWLPYRIPVGVPGRAAADLSVDRLAVVADRNRLHLVSVDHGLPVRPTAFTMLALESSAPVLVRFLLDLASEGIRPLRAWSWGQARHAPFLPRVRLGRVVLTSACWHSRGGRLADAAAGSHAELRAALRRWRQSHQVPQLVLLENGDRRIPLDLTDEVHCVILQQELRTRGDIPVFELPGGEDASDSWFAGPAGPHSVEIVVPLLRHRLYPRAASQHAAPPVPRAMPDPPPPPARLHRPGGEWLYAKLYCAAARQSEILGLRLPALLAEVAGRIDRWFFVRYADPRPHLRLRLHGRPDELWRQVLDRVHVWADALCRDALLDDLVLDSYDPELERYGAGSLMAAAESAFGADSHAVLCQLQLA